MSVRFDGEAGAATAPAGVSAAAAPADRDFALLWRLLSIALFCGAWEIAGQIPINFALPPFSDTVKRSEVKRVCPALPPPPPLCTTIRPDMPEPPGAPWTSQ